MPLLCYQIKTSKNSTIAEILNPLNLNKTAVVSRKTIIDTIVVPEDELNHKADDFQNGIAQSRLRTILLEMERGVRASSACGK